MKTQMLRFLGSSVTLVLAVGSMLDMAHAQADRGAKIAEQAFIYGFPMVMNYAVFYQYFIDKSDPSSTRLRSTRSGTRRTCLHTRTQQS